MHVVEKMHNITCDKNIKICCTSQTQRQLHEFGLKLSFSRPSWLPAWITAH